MAKYQARHGVVSCGNKAKMFMNLLLEDPECTLKGERLKTRWHIDLCIYSLIGLACYYLA